MVTKPTFKRLKNESGSLAVTAGLALVALAGVMGGITYSVYSAKQTSQRLQSRTLDQFNDAGIKITSALYNSGLLNVQNGKYAYSPPSGQSLQGLGLGFYSGSSKYWVPTGYFTDRACSNAESPDQSPHLVLSVSDPSQLSSAQLNALFQSAILPTVSASPSSTKSVTVDILGQRVVDSTDLFASVQMPFGSNTTVKRTTNARISTPTACIAYASTEPLAQLYRNLLAREPSPMEIASNMPSLANGNSTPAIFESALRGSAEYQANNSSPPSAGTNSEQVISLFRTLGNGQQPTQAQMIQWSTYLGSHGLQATAQGIRYSLSVGETPLNGSVVAELYRMFSANSVCNSSSLVSPAEDPNLASLAAGTTTYQDLETLLLSDVAGGAGASEEEVIALFRALLAREPSPSELANFAAVLMLGQPQSMPVTQSPQNWVSQTLQASYNNSEFQTQVNGCPATEPPPQCNLTASAPTVFAGTPVTLTGYAYGNINSSNGVQINWGSGPVGDTDTTTLSGSPFTLLTTTNTPSLSHIQTPATPGTLTATMMVTGPGGSNTCTAYIDVVKPGPPSCSIIATAPVSTSPTNPTTVSPGVTKDTGKNVAAASGQPLTLQLTTAGVINPGGISITWPDGHTQNNTSPYTYTPTASNAAKATATVTGLGGSGTCTTPVTVDAPCSMTVSSSNVSVGESVTFTAQATGAINPGGISITWPGSATNTYSASPTPPTILTNSFTPTAQATYTATMTVTGPSGPQSCSAKVSATLSCSIFLGWSQVNHFGSWDTTGTWDTSSGWVNLLGNWVVSIPSVLDPPTSCWFNTTDGNWCLMCGSESPTANCPGFAGFDGGSYSAPNAVMAGSNPIGGPPVVTAASGVSASGSTTAGMPNSLTYGGATYKLTGRSNGVDTDVIYGDDYSGGSMGTGIMSGTGWVYSGQCTILQMNVSPLAVNLDNQPIRMTTPFNPTPFDLNGDGSDQAYCWPKTPRTAWIAYDRDGTGRVRNINDLFGNNTIGPDGKKADNGFEALKKYDDDKDGFIDEKDAIYSHLVLWFDRNLNGKSTPREIVTLKEAHIKAIDLRYINKQELNDKYGNMSRERSVLVMDDNSLKVVYDLWLAEGITKKELPRSLSSASTR